jgi:LemA protein
MRTFAIVAVILLVVALLVGGKVVSIRNELVTQRNAIEAAWAQVDVALQRRADLIPNLVETVKGFAAQERQVIQSVTEARAALVGARTPQERMAANAQLDAALARLLVIVENYPQLKSNENFPQLKSNENFLRLQDELAGTENRIAVERRKYNEAVQRYNTTLELFPNNLVAALFGFTRNNDYFRVEPGARTAPQVKF